VTASANSVDLEDQPSSTGVPVLNLLGFDEAEASDAEPSVRTVASWVRTYLMRPHADLGRAGHVCPFTAQSARLSLIRIGASPRGAGESDAVVRTMKEAIRVFDALPCKRSARIFRTIIVVFPNCADAAGIETLHAAQNALRHHSIVYGKMIGLFEPQSQATGLLNPAFRPLRAPVPVLAIRMLVEQDAPFVLRNPLLLPIYLLKFPFVGLKRLHQSFRAARKPASLQTS
jgi:hypothetical protein